MKSTYDSFAKEFSQTRQYVWDDIKPLLKYTKDKNNILDLGCGNGRLYQLFVGKAISYAGLDQSEELIKKAQEKFSKAKFVVGNMIKLPFLDKTFDIIYCIAAFHHLTRKSDRLLALQEMKRVLKPNGKVVMTSWNLLGDWAEKKMKIGDWKLREGEKNFIIPWRNSKREILGERIYHAFDLDELKKIFEKAEFKVEENFYSKRGERSDKKDGTNIVSVVTSPSPNTPLARSTASR